MSQQLQPGRGGRGHQRNRQRYGRGGNMATKAFKSPIKEIEYDTFNTGQSAFAAQFSQSRETVARYLQRQYHDQGFNVAQTLKTGEEQTIPLPDALAGADVNDQDLITLRNQAVKSVGKERVQLQKDLKRAFATVFEQCSMEVREKLKASDGWATIEQNQSLHELINKIERICVGFDDHKQEVFNLVQSVKTVYLYSQGEKESVDEYARNQKSLWDTAVAFGASPGYHQKLVEDHIDDNAADTDNPTDEERRAAEAAVSEAVRAALLVSGADKKRFGGLKKELANDYLKGSDNYPDTLDEAIRLLGNYSGPSNTNAYRRQPPRDEGEVAFLQQGGRGGGGRGGGRGGSAGRGGGAAAAGRAGRGGGEQPRTNRAGESHCFNCGSEDHWAADCPEPEEDQQAQLQMNLGAGGDEEQEDAANEDEDGLELLNFSMLQGGGLSKTRGYLDNCSTITAFMNPDLLDNIKTVKKGMRVNCNAGVVRTDQQGKFGSIKTWYLPDGIANIFSMHELEKLYRITYDSWDGFYVVHTESGPVHFYKDENGLPYIDLVESDNNAATLLVQTVRGNYEGHTKKDVLRAKEARRAQGMIGGPSDKDFKAMVSSKLIENCPIDSTDVTNAKAIFGPNLQRVRGSTVRRKPDAVVESYVAIPRDDMLSVKVVTMAADVFFVDGIALLLTLSRKINFVTTEHTPCRTAKQLTKHIKRVLRVYYRAGIKVRYVLMDGEFEKVKEHLPETIVNTTAAKEHVAEAERKIRVVKERGRGVICTMPFTFIPKRMKIEFIYFVTLWLNAFPVNNGISSKYSPRELLVRWRMDYKKHCRVEVGTYCEVHDEPSPTNGMTSRTHEAIALGPTGNLQGSVKFYCLTTGRVLKRRNFTQMPMPDSVIKRVNSIGKKEKQGRQFRFHNRHNEPFEWTDEVPEDDPEFQGLLEEEAPFPDVSAELPGVELERDAVLEPTEAVEDEAEPDMEERAAAALDNAGIDIAQRIREGRDEPGLVGAEPGEIVYEIQLDGGSSAGGGSPASVDDDTAHTDGGDEPIIVETVVDEEPDEGIMPAPPPPPPPAPLPNIPSQAAGRYPTRARRSVRDHDPYSNFSPQVQFLQSATCEAQLLRIAQSRARRSVVGNGGDEGEEEGYLNLVQNALEEGGYDCELDLEGCTIDDTEHTSDPELSTCSEDELAMYGYLLTQYNLKAGLREFGDKGVNAAEAELNQLHVMDTWEVQDPKKLSRVQKVKALSSLMFLKEKRCGKVKGRACINGAPQRAYIPKEDAASPTVSNESVFITAAIAAYERRHVRCFDVPGAFLHTETDEDVLMALRGPLAEMMVRIAPEVYREYVAVDSKGTPILYVKLKKALYGMLRSSLLFYRKLRKELEADGFVVNPYDPCVANKMVPVEDGALKRDSRGRVIAKRKADGTVMKYKSGKTIFEREVTWKQMTVVWHVDDLMVTCEDSFAITKFACYLAGIYGPKLAMHMGKKHDYLGIDFEFRDDGKLDVSMFESVDSIIKDFPEEITSKSATPAAEHLFKIRNDSEAKLLSEERALIFHRFVARLLFVSTRPRRDIQVAVSFLTTRVKKPDEDDWGKLKRVIKYLYGTRRLKLTLSVDSLNTIKWYVDASHNVHWDCKGHAGAVMTMGEGGVTSYSRKVKLNTRSSTETEVVGADMFMPEMLWSLHFINAQGYGVSHVELFQDNISAQMLEINGRFSSSKKTKHIKAKFFFIKDRIDDGEIKVVDCPTEEMWADIETKPLQGKLFREMRAKLMNCAVDYTEDVATGIMPANKEPTKRPTTLAGRVHTAKPSQECVGNSAHSRFARTSARTRQATRGGTWMVRRKAVKAAKE